MRRPWPTNADKTRLSQGEAKAKQPAAEGTACPLSVVIATTKAWPEIEPCLESLHWQALAMGAEVLVGDGHGQGLPMMSLTATRK